MAPKKTRAIGIFANLACVVSLTLRNSDRPLFPKADVQTSEIGMKLRAANGRGCVKTHRISRTMGQHPTLVTKASQMRFRFPISVSNNCESRCNLPPTLFISRFHTASAESGSSNRWRFSGTKDRYTSILLKNSWLEKRTCMRVSYFEARCLKKNSSQLSYAFICGNLARKASKIVFQHHWGRSGRSTISIQAMQAI